MALWRNNAEGNMEKENVNLADPLCWEKNQKHHNQTVCALAVAILCALILALLVLDFRFEWPFAAGVDTNAEPLSEPPWYSADTGLEGEFHTWLFVCISFISGILILVAAVERWDRKHPNR